MCIRDSNNHSVSQQSSSCADQQQPSEVRTTRLRRKSQEQGRVTGGTRKERAKLRLEAKLKELKSRIKKKAVKEKDPLLERLTHYHSRLLSEVDNVLTEKVSAEVNEVVNDLSQVDDIRRSFQWSKADEERLNRMNAEAKKLSTPCLLYTSPSPRD